MPLPDVVTMNQLFGKTGAIAPAVAGDKALQQELQAGRLMRKAQPQWDHFGYRAEADFSDATAANGGQPTDWVDFANMKFTEEPFVTTGSKRMAFPGEPALATEGENFDPAVHMSCPGYAEVLVWRIDANGMYTGAKLLLYALGVVPVGFKVLVYAVFSGPCIKTG